MAVHDHVSAQCPRHLCFVGPADHADDSSAGGFGELDRGATDPAGSSVDEPSLLGLQVRSVVKS
jgi:hypothetical protein